MNTDEAIVYSGCVQHFLKVDAQPTYGKVEQYVLNNGGKLSEDQKELVIKYAVTALNNANKNVL